MLANVAGEIHEGIDPPEVRFANPEVPKIDSTVKVVEAQLKPQCWFQNLFSAAANAKIPGAITQTEVIIHCNHRVEAPLTIMVEFDKDFLPGWVGTRGGAEITSRGLEKHGRIIRQELHAPSLPAEQLAFATVYGTTQDHPRAVRANITSQ